MMWHQHVIFLEHDDYKRASYPKKTACAVLGVWGLGALGLSILFSSNPEKFYKRFLFTPFSGLFALTPVVALIFYQRSQSRTYKELYDKYVGNLSDEELLNQDAKYNPNR
jgi:hypothetical protein